MLQVYFKNTCNKRNLENKSEQFLLFFLSSFTFFNTIEPKIMLIFPIISITLINSRYNDFTDWNILLQHKNFSKRASLNARKVTTDVYELALAKL